MNRGKTERLLNLVLALMSSSRPMNREEIRRSVSGYENCSSDDAFERMFERDKDELRSMGLPVETMSNAFDEVLGYRISVERYQFRELDLSARDLEILSVALRVWDEAMMTNSARTAKWKIESNTADVIAESEFVGVARIRAESSAMLPLINAARERKVVTFTYQRLDREPELRIFEPWSVICRSGRWYTVGYDQARSAQRTFNLARISGNVKITAKATQSEPPESRFADIDLPDGDTFITATIVLSKNGGATLRRNASNVEYGASFDTVSLTAPEDRLTSWVMGSIPEVQSIQPEQLRNSVMNKLQNILVRHRG